MEKRRKKNPKRERKKQEGSKRRKREDEKNTALMHDIGRVTRPTAKTLDRTEAHIKTRSARVLNLRVDTPTGRPI